MDVLAIAKRGGLCPEVRQLLPVMAGELVELMAVLAELDQLAKTGAISIGGRSIPLRPSY